MTSIFTEIKHPAFCKLCNHTLVMAFIIFLMWISFLYFYKNCRVWLLTLLLARYESANWSILNCAHDFLGCGGGKNQGVMLIRLLDARNMTWMWWGHSRNLANQNSAGKLVHELASWTRHGNWHANLGTRTGDGDFQPSAKRSMHEP